MNAKATTATESPARSGLVLSERTSETDDQRIQDVTPLPPPEHLIRFFPIAGTPTEKLIKHTRSAVRHIMHGKDDRLLVIIGPCSIHDPMMTSRRWTTPAASHPSARATPARWRS